MHGCSSLKTLKQSPHFERSAWKVSCFVGIVCVPQSGTFSLSDFELVILLVLTHFVLFPADNLSVFLGRIWAPYANMLSLDCLVICKIKIHCLTVEHQHVCLWLLLSFQDFEKK